MLILENNLFPQISIVPNKIVLTKISEYMAYQQYILLDWSVVL